MAAAGDGTPVLYSLSLPLAMLLNSTAFPPLPSSFMFVDCCVLCRTWGATTSQSLRPLELQGLFYKSPKFNFLSTLFLASKISLRQVLFKVCGRNIKQKYHQFLQVEDVLTLAIFSTVAVHKLSLDSLR